jgi:hypothetical protein
VDALCRNIALEGVRVQAASVTTLSSDHVAGGGGDQVILPLTAC